jgi:hypothetical protein
MTSVDVSKYNCDSTALESLPLDKVFEENFKVGGGKRSKRSKRSRSKRSRSKRSRSKRSRRSRSKRSKRSRSKRSSNKKRRSRSKRSKRSGNSKRSSNSKRSKRSSNSKRSRSKRSSKRSSNKQRRSSKRNSKRSSKRSSNKQRQSGGSGYFLNVESERIGGLSEVTGYNSQPELLNGKMVKSTLNDTLCGGGKKRVNHLRSNNTGRRTKRTQKRNVKKNRKGRIVYRKVGGGEESVYTDDMSKREFGCRQPDWNTKCI